MAKEYRDAANLLFDINAHPESPLYFLYSHSIELAFRAFLRVRDRPVRKIHDLAKLLRTCKSHGFKAKDNRDLQNVVELLQSENEFHGFRYFAFTNSTIPEITYLREVANDLVTVMAKEVENAPIKVDDVPGCAVVKMTVSKPQEQ